MEVNFVFERDLTSWLLTTFLFLSRLLIFQLIEVEKNKKGGIIYSGT